jgi:tetratricopeptide (TPR) repeat protein
MTDDVKHVLADSRKSDELFPEIERLEDLLKTEPDNENYKLQLANAYIDTGQVAAAESILRTCIAEGNDVPQVKLILGHALKALGKMDEAAECYLEVANQEDDAISAVGYWSIANLKSYRFDDLTLTSLRDRVQQSEMGSSPRGLMLFTLAAAWEQRDNHEAAFMAMSEANLVFASQRPFRADLYGAMIKSMCEKVTSPTTLPPIDGPTPIFIVGMPRSGTTLVEQILASHSQVEATDELPFLTRMGLDLEQAGGYAEALANMTEERQQALAGEYLERASQYRREGLPFFIDKAPHNFLHIGLIKALFPNAKIINVIRDPLDNAIGVFKMYFGQGAEFSFSLEGIIYYWQGYVTLMNHWNTVYPDGVMHLSYEDLANNPEAKIEELLEYCGLPIEEQCFRFYESDRPVLTPSAGQVRSPISTKSIGSGQKYEKYIKTSIPALAEIKIRSREVFGIS